ncbi:MAG: protein kinase, partial [Fimbriimonadaceae bacterium]
KFGMGEKGVALVEVKHWDSQWVQKNQAKADAEAEKLAHKAKRLKGFLQKRLHMPNLRVDQVLVLTRDGVPDQMQSIRGARVLGLGPVGKIADELDGPRLKPDQVRLAVECLCPESKIRTHGRIRTFGEYTNLELVSSPEARFHRVYRGIHGSTKDRIVLHVYDLSASTDKDPQKLASREFEVIRLLQKSRYVPAVREFLGEADGYPGELLYGVVFDPSAPSLEQRCPDKAWSIEDRLLFARRALSALGELHQAGAAEGFVHRNISGKTILVASGNNPLFIDFSISKLNRHETLFEGVRNGVDLPWVAPEIRERGFSAATQASDFYSLCFALKEMFSGLEDERARQAADLLVKVCSETPEERVGLLAEVEQGLERLQVPAAEDATGDPAARELPVQYWCEGTTVAFRGDRLQVVSVLGSGGVGHTFKVDRFSGATGEPLGTYVAKVIREHQIDSRIKESYERARVASAEPGLATVFDVETELKPNQVFALLEWVDGQTLDAVAGNLAACLIEGLGERVTDLLRRWLNDVCSSLNALHRLELVHGDVSPRNLVLSQGRIRLIDYDLVTREGQVPAGAGAPAYCSPEAVARKPCTASDDIYALSASLFSVAFGCDPFPETGDGFDKSRGLDWTEERREALGDLAGFFETATHPDPSKRFQNIGQALASLEPEARVVETSARSENVVPWLRDLLTVYPGSQHGNIETRGLDSSFAESTYVPTALEDALYDDLRSRKVRLLILCGNAGDGKTALLQHLAQRFGVDRVVSGNRIWESRTDDGLLLKANLDGAASWNGRSANELLDEFFEPFLGGVPSDDRAHLLAINDGRLLEWLRLKEEQIGKKPLIAALLNGLANDDDPRSMPDHVRFISLNHRSLVGGIDENSGDIHSEFLDQLLRKMLGGEQREGHWAPCQTCSAYERCPVGPTATSLLASFRETDADDEKAKRGRRLRERLGEALRSLRP